LDKATSLRNGIQLVSYNAQTKQITVNISVVPTEAPIVVTGTLRTAGNGLMGAWFYNNFATENDRKAARAAINAAEVNLVSAGADLERSAQQTAADQRRVDNALLELTQQTIAVNDDQRTATQELQIKTAQQFQAMQANLSNLASQQQNYLQAFAGFVDDPFAQAALDITT
jgi:hypothetical protein